MRTCYGQYYGRGGVRIPMPRPRIDPETWQVMSSDWGTLIRQFPKLFLQTRFLNILAIILVVVLFNAWLTSFHRKEPIPGETRGLKKMRLVIRKQSVRPKRPAAPIPEPQIKPKIQPIQPATEPLKPTPRPKTKTVVQKKKLLRPAPAAVAKPKPVRKTGTRNPEKPKPVPIDLEDSLKMEKSFDLPVMETVSRRPRPAKGIPVFRKKPDLDGVAKILAATASHTKRSLSARPVREQAARKLQVGREMENPDLDSVTVIAASTRTQACSTAFDSRDMGLGLDAEIPPSHTTAAATERSRRPFTTLAGPLDGHPESEIMVAVQDNDVYTDPERTAAPSRPVSPPATRETETGISRDSAAFTTSGISLVQLKSCGPVEKTIKIKLAELVRQRGYPKACEGPTGIYRFYWPSERFTVPHFNVIIYTAQGRIATDRCEELANACDCLQKN